MDNSVGNDQATVSAQADPVLIEFLVFLLQTRRYNRGQAYNESILLRLLCLLLTVDIAACEEQLSHPKSCALLRNLAQAVKEITTERDKRQHFLAIKNAGVIAN